MSGPGAQAGNNAGEALRKGVGLVHGAGEAIRGNINAAVDSAAKDPEGVAKNEAIASRGADEMDRGHHHHTGTGVATAGTTHTGAATAGTTHTGPATYESHTPNLGHKTDQYDSGLGLRRIQTDGASSNYGPHSTAVGNELDPRYDSDLDHRGTTQGFTNYGTHHTDLQNDLNSRYSDQDNRGPGYRCHACGAMNSIHGTNISNNRQPRHDYDMDHRGVQTGSTAYRPHNEPDHRGRGDFASGQGFTSAYSDSRDHGHQAGSTAQPHGSTILNKLDPRVDSKHDDWGPDNYMPVAPYRRESEPMLPFTSAYEDMEARHASQDAETPSQWLPFFNPQPSQSPCPEQYYEDVYENQAQDSRRADGTSATRVGGQTLRSQSLSTKYPHNSFLNLLDPKANRNPRRKLCSKSEM